MRRITTPLVLATAAFVGAGGFVHLREWLDSYRHLPAGVPGAAVVQVGFPINTAVSVVLAVALLATVFVLRRFAVAVLVATFLFQAGSLTALIISRTGSLFGWAEPIWTRGADQARAVELGALLALAGIAAVVAFERRTVAATPHHLVAARIAHAH